MLPPRAREAIDESVRPTELARLSPARALAAPHRSNNNQRSVRLLLPRPSRARAPGRWFLVPNNLTIGRFPPPRSGIDRASQNSGGHKRRRDRPPTRSQNAASARDTVPPVPPFP